MRTTVRPKVNEIAEDGRTFVIAKLSHLHTSLLADKVDESLVLKNQQYKLAKFQKRTSGIAWIKSSLSKEILFDRYTFLTRKRLKEEPVKKFYGCLQELFLNCDFGSHEEFIIRDVFIAIRQDCEIQQELLKESRTAKKA